MNKYTTILKLLGLPWVLSRIGYLLKLKTGWLKKKSPVKNWHSKNPVLEGKFFKVLPVISKHEVLLIKADNLLKGEFSYFYRTIFFLGFPPDWNLNPFPNKASNSNLMSDRFPGKHWSEIPDFTFGDIKGVWEIARFAWVYPLAQAFQHTKNEEYAKKLWALISDWAEKNPPNTGVHWKCGQEIAIRMFAVVTAFFSLNDSQLESSEEKQLVENIVFESAKRIEANIGYALSQKNNHGISEAAGLFTAGVLFKKGKWLNKGKRLLEVQAKELIYDDGSFSQHSSNYHRLILQVFLWVIQLGKANGIAFSKETLCRVRSAGQWLLEMHDSLTGRVPNLGSNDGALIFPIAECDYLDYRPTIQAVGVIIDNKQWLKSGPWDALAKWFDPDMNFSSQQICVPYPASFFHHYSEGGYAVWQEDSTKVLFRCPEKFKHRPAQCDLLHIDVFHKGINVLRDSGTYSYNCEEPWQSYFKSVAAHNIIQFDDHDQMPQISRFLYGKWPKLTVEATQQNEHFAVIAGFKDWHGCQHTRKVEYQHGMIRITDFISSFREKAILRWRLSPELQWKIQSNECISELCKIKLTADSGIRSIVITDGWESLYYMEKTKLPVLEATVSPKCKILTTEIHFLR